MKVIKEMIDHNARFVAEGEYKKFETTKYPDKKIAVVTCMDTRLVELLPAALDIKNGDVKMIRNAGGLVTDPFGTTMRSILVAIYELGVEHVMIIAHTGCGVQGMNGHHFIEMMKERGIPAERIELLTAVGIDLEGWLTGFDDTQQAVRDSVRLVTRHPLLPKGVSVSGWVMDTLTGHLTPVDLLDI